MVRGIANSKIGFGDLILLLRYFFKLKVSTHPNQPLEFLPYLADHTEQSLKILIQAAEQQNTRLVLLSQPVSYPLDPALQSDP